MTYWTDAPVDKTTVSYDLHACHSSLSVRLSKDTQLPNSRLTGPEENIYMTKACDLIGDDKDGKVIRGAEEPDEDAIRIKPCDFGFRPEERAGEEAPDPVAPEIALD